MNVHLVQPRAMRGGGGAERSKQQRGLASVTSLHPRTYCYYGLDEKQNLKLEAKRGFFT